MTVQAENTVHEVQVLREREDGSGGIVRLPLLPSGIEIDLSRTSGGGKGTVKVTQRMLEEIAGNFGDWPMPVALAFPPHTDDRNGPQPAFVDSVSVDDGVLWGEIDAGAFLFSMLVRERAFRGASVELRRDPKTATVEMDGWVLVGGILTNQPATPTLFKIAAEGDDPEACSIRGTAAFQFRPDGHREHDMSKDTAALEAKVQEQTTALEQKDARIAELETKLSAAEEQTSSQAESITSLQASVKTLTGELATIRKETLTDKVTAAIAAAKEKGVPVSVFAGSDDDPVKWMETTFTNFEAFQQMLDAFPAAKQSTVRSSNGNGPGTSGGNAVDLEAEAKKVMAEGKADTFDGAMKFIRDTNPDLYAAGTAGLRLHRKDD